MNNNKFQDVNKVIIVTPAGRRRYLDLLSHHLKKQKQSFDEWHLWLNTNNIEDIEFCKKLAQNSPWIKTFDLEVPYSGNSSINSFFKYAAEEKTIYIRLDDDVVYLEPRFVEKMILNRIEDKTAPFIYPLIINNGNICAMMQQFNKFDNIEKISVVPNCQNELFYQPHIAEKIHKEFIKDVLNNNIEKYYINNYYITDYHRCSINCISWFGEIIKMLNYQIPGDEEQFLSVDVPRSIAHPNKVTGNAICAHYAFVTQREYIDKNTNILELYRSLI